MKHSYILLFIALLFLPAFISCRPSVHSVMPDETLMERLLKENPDSLAILLEDEMIPSTLSDADKADYAWWLIQTHKKQKRSMVNDTLIHFTVEYYKKNNSPRLAKAYRLAAEQVNWSGNDYIETEKLLIEALREAENQKDTAYIIEINYLLSGIYQRTGEREKVISKNKDLLRFMDPKNDFVLSYNHILGFDPLEMPDSIIKYARPVIEKAKLNDPSWEYTFLRIYAEALTAKHSYTEALQILYDLNGKSSAR